MSDPGERTLIEEVLVAGLSDWVDDAVVCGNVARRATEDSEDRRAIALGLISVLLHRRLAIAGEIDEGGFVVWDLEPGAAFAKIASAWMSLSVDVRPGDVVWLQNTAEGDRVARSVLDREGASG